MNKEQTKNIVIAVVVILLIAGGIYYSKSKDNTEEPAVLEENSTELPIVDEKTDETIKEEATPQTENTTSKPQISTENKAKFNTAMKNASIAFGNKEYPKAITYYNEALSYYKTDKVYSGLFIVYSAQNNIDKARVALDTAIKLNSTYTEYWIWKIVLLDEKTDVSFADLKKIYQEGLTKTDPRSKINLVTTFARIAENNKENKEAIALWEYAKEMNPSKSVIYQQEIDRLKIL